MTFRIFGLALAAMAALGLSGGCVTTSKDEGSGGTGARGESCVASQDCGTGLACVSGICSVRTFGLSVSKKDCVRIQCREAADCTDDSCDSLERDCAAGDTYSCTQYDGLCDASRWACESDQCIQTCTTDGDCGIGACVAGRCEDCASDDDCFGDYICVDAQCVEGCQEKADCPFFHDCKSGQCVYTGCSTNRECVAATGSTRAVCEKSNCVIPCTTDIECDDPYNYDFYQCISGRCTAIGCESDTECRIRLNVEQSGDDAECRLVTTP